MRRILLLATLGALGVAGVAYAATLTNDYVIKAKISPTRSGTPTHPKSISTRLEWDVTTSPPGRRPNVVRGYKIFYAGIRANTTDFPGCGTSRLSGSSASPGNCPKGSQIGTGYIIIEFGPTGQNASAYNGTCRAEIIVFNGGAHSLTFFVFPGSQVSGQPAPCTIPGGHAAINANIRRGRSGISEHFSVPQDLRHPAPGLDSAVIKAVLHIGAKSRTIRIRRHHKTIKEHVGLFESVACAKNHQRQVAITFTDENGQGRKRTTLVRCT